MQIIPTNQKIEQKYIKFRSKINLAWRAYNYQFIALNEFRLNAKKSNGKIFVIENLVEPDKSMELTKRHLDAYANHLILIDNPRKTLYNIVSLTEFYLQDLIYFVYIDQPFKMVYIDQEESPDQQLKLLHTIAISEDRDEILDKIAEEKIRSIFYGNPVDFFIKDKAKIGIDKTFGRTYSKAIQQYSELIARRNIITHNDGKVDRKYLREVKNSSFKIGDKPTIDKEYIRDSIKLLRNISAKVTSQVIDVNYNKNVYSKWLKKDIDRFDEWYKE